MSLSKPLKIIDAVSQMLFLPLRSFRHSARLLWWRQAIEIVLILHCADMSDAAL